MLKVWDIAFVKYQVTDLDKTEKFFNDFGLVTISKDAEKLYLRSASSNSYTYVAQKASEAKFLGVAFVVNSFEDLQKATTISGASEIVELDGPCGGKSVIVPAPTNFEVSVVYGLSPLQLLEEREAIQYNSSQNSPRVNVPVRTKVEATLTSRISHAAILVENATIAVEWFKEKLGFLASDYIKTPDGSTIAACFMRADKGIEPCDHHTLAIVQDPQLGVHHSSFWTTDMDSLCAGHYWLKAQGHKHEHGIGRHCLGSQIFDYWRCPDGFLFEKYTDGDVFDNSVPSDTHEFSTDLFFQWCEPPNPSFFASKV